MNQDTSREKNRLLIIDDLPANIGVLFDCLNAANYEVLVAKSGRGGLRKAEIAQPDLILLDVMMPEMDGFEVCRQLKRQSITRHIPVIFMTALSETVDKVKGLQLGAVDYITKPFEHEEVLARINTHLELRRLQRQLEEKNQALEKQNQSLNAVVTALRQLREESQPPSEKTQFLAGMSHELRTPMNAILGYSQVLMDEARQLRTDYDFVGDLEKINAAGHKLLGLINEILDFSRLEAGSMEFEPSDCDMLMLLHELQNRAEPTARRNGNNLRLRFPDDIGEIYTDKSKLYRVLAHLLDNAGKFTENGEIFLEIEIYSQHDIEHALFRVRDTGKGISPGEQARLFEVFTQGDASISRRHEGIGLGLALVKRLVELLHGRLEVSSEPGQGSCFSVHIPVDFRLALARVGETEESAPQAVGRGKVLIIDDDPVTCALLHNYIEGLGYQAHVARNGGEGLKLAHQLRPDIITLDIIMPEMDGWAVLSALKSDPKLAGIPVFMLSIEEEENRGYALDAAGFLSKPVNQNQLGEVLTLHRPHHGTPEVLVVDDDADGRRLLSQMLRQENWHISEAVNGLEALARVGEHVPDLIITDLMMPEMDGFEFLRVLREHSEWRTIPVVVLTARDLTRQEREQLNAGMANVFQKGSYHRDQLLGEVREALATLSSPDYV